MNAIAAYALLVLGGKAEPSAADVDKVLKEAGAKSDKTAELCEALKGKAFHELIAAGTAKMGSCGSAAPAAGGAKAAVKAEVKKEESEEEADVDMGGLFGDDY